MKPRQLPANTGALPSLFARAAAVATTAGRVARPRTISTSRITLAGLKKCTPITISGRRVALAMPSTSSEDVLVARTQSALTKESSSANTCRFTARSSKTASMTMSACSNPSQVSCGVISVPA